MEEGRRKSPAQLPGDKSPTAGAEMFSAPPLVGTASPSSKEGRRKSPAQLLKNNAGLSEQSSGNYFLSTTGKKKIPSVVVRRRFVQDTSTSTGASRCLLKNLSFRPLASIFSPTDIRTGPRLRRGCSPEVVASARSVRDHLMRPEGGTTGSSTGYLAPRHASVIFLIQ
jgi:hypothetical protein